jgi:2-dehydropantoate 2-reductase
MTASMLRDLESGGRVEADQIVGDMLRRGRALGVDVALLRVAYAHLQAYQQRLLRAVV